MSRIIVVVACGLGLASCASWTPSFSWIPSFDSGKPKVATANLTVESDPPGAEARTSQGQSCRTPCTLAVPTSGEFAVSYTLNGYTPQSVTVRAQTVGGTFSLDGGSGGETTLEPNPVFVELKPSGPPPKPPPPKKKKRPLPPPAAPGAAAAGTTAPPPPLPAVVVSPQQTLQSPYPPPPGGFTPTPPGIGR